MEGYLLPFSEIRLRHWPRHRDRDPDQPLRTHVRIHAGLVLTRRCLGETLQINVLVDRGEDGQYENWAPTPARWPLPRHYFARIVFIARASSHVGPLLKR